MPRSSRVALLDVALKLKEASAPDWAQRSVRQTGTNLRVTDDTALVARLRAARLAEVLQAPTRGRQPPTGRLKYILKVYANADAPLPERSQTPNPRALSTKERRIPYYLLAPLLRAATTEWNKQRTLVGQQLEETIVSLEARLLSTRDRNEKKRLADELQTALHADETMDAEIAKRVYAKLAASEEAHSEFVDLIDWTARR